MLPAQAQNPTTPAIPPSSNTTSTQSIPFTPQFTHNVLAWFTHIEATWAEQAITDEAKFQAIIRALPSDTFAIITPSLTNLTPGHKYSGIKSALIAALGKTTRQHLQELEAVQADGRCPSALLHHMLQLNMAAGAPLPECIIRMRHAKLMPTHIQMILSTQSNLSLQEYGELADTLMETQAEQHIPWPPPTSGIQRTTHIHKTPQSSTTQPQPPPVPDHQPHIVRQLQELTEQVRRLQHTSHYTPTPPPPTNASPHALTPMPLQLQRNRQPLLQQPLSITQRLPQSAVCHYHHKFGASARNCRPPCNWGIHQQPHTSTQNQGNL